MENYLQFPGAVENDQEVKRCSWKNCYFVEVVRWNQEEEKRHHHQGGDGGEDGDEGVWFWRMTNHQVVLPLEKRREGRRRRRWRNSTPRKRRNSTPRKRCNSTPWRRGSSPFDGVGWEKKKKKEIPLEL